ncbi:hypothetical protein TNIN_427591 [Trichonephila inaurata madagascariensis]|uniref:Uncharacterized protein n=1 Tax=Trichonephila inaurata madagascariensis TaxID=2747483 RepID=A0A8X6WLB9_9ARAC|nr:hypothetical protein TNIN_427591 [Trichonephila inaurata madagascariensis]
MIKIHIPCSRGYGTNYHRWKNFRDMRNNFWYFGEKPSFRISFSTDASLPVDDSPVEINNTSCVPQIRFPVLLEGEVAILILLLVGRVLTGEAVGVFMDRATRVSQYGNCQIHSPLFQTILIVGSLLDHFHKGWIMFVLGIRVLEGGNHVVVSLDNKRKRRISAL